LDSKPSRVADYLLHVREAIERINRYTNGMVETDFLANQLTQDAVIRNLEVIGEACRNIDRNCPEFVAEHPELPLSSAYEMRNALAHGYFKVDLKIVWKTIGSDLPDLLRRVGNILQESGS
jgi:uncharacterized protein with HEPN domain